MRDRGRVGRRLGSEGLARPGPELDRPFLDERGRQSGDAADRPEQCHDRRQVVRAHVEEGAGSVPEEDVRIRMPRLLPACEHRRGDGKGVSDRASIDEAAGLLVRTAEEDVRCAADLEPSSVRRCEEVGGIGRDHRERLLGIDVLALLEREPGHVAVSRRRRQVEDDVDRRARQQLVRLHRGKPVLVGKGGASGLVEVGAGDDLERAEGRGVRRILSADDAAADHPDTRRAVHDGVPASRPCSSTIEVLTASNDGPSTSSCSTISHSTPA